MSSPWEATPVPGVLRTTRTPFLDDRGSFTKVLGEGDGEFAAREVFWSHSVQGTFRGMHAPLPPYAARKLVFVTSGEVRDFVLDLRHGSPEFGRVHEFALHSGTGGLVIPVGCAHGFEVISAEASMVYLQEDFHSPAHDGGVRYTSCDIVLAAAEPIVSARDLALPALAEFDSPFELR